MGHGQNEVYLHPWGTDKMRSISTHGARTKEGPSSAMFMSGEEGGIGGGGGEVFVVQLGVCPIVATAGSRLLRPHGESDSLTRVHVHPLPALKALAHMFFGHLISKVHIDHFLFSQL